MVQKVDALESKCEYIISKIEHNLEYADIEARNNLVNKIIALIIKCTNIFNLFRLREEIMSNNKINGECPRCSRLEN